MTTKHTNLALVEGEVLILSNEEIKPGDIIYNSHPHAAENIGIVLEGHGVLHYQKTGYTGCNKILASTSKLEGIPQLDRKWFVKPKVDVEDLAIEIFNLESKEEFSTEDIQSINDFKAGYSAKEAEFTETDIINAMYDAREYPTKRTPEDTFSDFVKSYLNKSHPLSSPKSVTLNENNEVIEVEW